MDVEKLVEDCIDKIDQAVFGDLNYSKAGDAVREAIGEALAAGPQLEVEKLKLRDGDLLLVKYARGGSHKTHSAQARIARELRNATPKGTVMILMPDDIELKNVDEKSMAECGWHRLSNSQEVKESARRFVEELRKPRPMNTFSDGTPLV